MDLFPQMTVNGLLLGVTIMMLALGLQFQLGVMRIVVFNYGEFYMLGGYVTWWLISRLGANYWLAMIVAAVTVSFAGIILERYFLRRFRGSLLPQVVITTGFVMLIQASVSWRFGTEPQVIASPFHGIVSLGVVRLSLDRLMVVLMATAVVAGTIVFWLRSRAGLAMRAVAQEPEAAQLCGMNVNSTCRLTMIASGILAAASGALLGPLFTLLPQMGLPAVLKALVIITVAGMGSIGGVVIAAIGMGLTESYLTTLVGSQVAMIAYFGILILFLVFRPRGIYGQEMHME